MNQASQYLVDLSRTIAQPYTALASLRAAMVTGSAAKGLADFYSDIDMTMYYEAELPAEEALHIIRNQLGGSERKWTIGNRDEGHFAEAYALKGIEVQIGHTTIKAWEEAISQVLEATEVATPTQKALEGTLACQALYGADYIDRWKTQLAAYPDVLAEAMVKNHLQFFPVWGLSEYLHTRDALLWYQEILVETTQRIMAVLAGLNRLYFTTFQFKRMHHFIQQMHIKPDNLAERVELLFQQDMVEAFPQIEALVSEVIALVEVQMPQIDTTRAKARLGWRHAPWQP